MPQYFFSLTEKTSLKPETNLIHYSNRTSPYTYPFSLVNSNVPDVALIDSAVRAISAYIVQEYTLEYLQSLFFSPDEQAFLTAVSRLVLPLTQN